MRQTYLALVCAALFLPACVAETGTEEEQQATESSDVTAASLRSAVKKAFVKETNEGSLSDLPHIARSKLPASIKKTFDKYNHEYGPDYPPYAVAMKAGTTATIILADDTDGGSYWEFYTTTGTHIIGASEGESGDLNWGE